MATIQKIRSYGWVLLAVVGLALFAFIVEEGVRAWSTSQNASRQVVGEICGDDITYQEFNDLYSEYETIVKLNNGGQNLAEQEAIQVRDQVWNTLVQQKALERETAKLGLTVTDAEVKAIINAGNSPVLRSTPFRNAQTGQFDVNQLTQFLSNYKTVMENPDMPAQQKEYFQQMKAYWDFIEKQVRNQALVDKYQALLSACITANPVSVKAEISARAQESTVLIAALPLTVAKDVKADDKDIEAKYKEYVKQYLYSVDMPNEARSIKYIQVPVVASAADKADLEKELNEYRDSLLSNPARVANIVRESRSLVSYTAMPMAKAALPADVAAAIDTLAVGTLTEPYTYAADNTMNVLSYIAKVQLPDSVQFSQIAVPGVDAKAQASADSILNALQAGAPLDTIAKTYNQSAAAQWLTSADVDGAQLNDDNRKLIDALFTTPAGTYKKLALSGAIVVLKVADRRNIIDKYDVAIIKRSIDFSDKTHSDAWNKFSSFLAANTTIEDIEANAMKEGYNVQTQPMLTSDRHYVGPISFDYASRQYVPMIPGSTEALRWVFDKAKVGAVSELYECGTTNDQLLVVMLTDIHPKGIKRMVDLKSELEDLATNDLQAAQLQEQMKGAKSVADVAKMQGAVSDTIQHITFASPVYVQKLGAQEPALAGAVAKAKKGDFVQGVRGQQAVYAFQVLESSKQENPASEEVIARQQATSHARSVVSAVNTVLYKKAKVEDNRYKFYQ